MLVIRDGFFVIVSRMWKRTTYSVALKPATIYIMINYMMARCYIYTRSCYICVLHFEQYSKYHLKLVGFSAVDSQASSHS